MNQLRELVRRYRDGEIDYQTFRREMVVRFLSARNEDATTENIANAIDGECADFSENRISEMQLKGRLIGLVALQASKNVAAVMQVYFDIVEGEFGTLAFPFAPTGTASPWLVTSRLFSSSRDPLPNDLTLTAGVG